MPRDEECHRHVPDDQRDGCCDRCASQTKHADEDNTGDDVYGRAQDQQGGGADEKDARAVTPAVQCLGMQHELPALGRRDRRNNRDLATELVGSPCLAAADALHLGWCNE